MKIRHIFPLLVTLILFGIVPRACGQDMNYSQAWGAPVYFNPAFTGINSGLRARFLFRDQWPTLPAPFKSYCFIADLGDRNLPGSGGLGIMVNQDTPGAGQLKNFGASITMGVRIPITSYLQSHLGVKVGMMQRSVNWGDLIFPDQYDPNTGNQVPTKFSPDLSKRTVADFGVGGILVYNNPEGILSGMAGFAADHLFQPDVSFFSKGSSSYPRRLTGQFDMVITTVPGSNSTSYGRGSEEPLKFDIAGIYQNQYKLNSLQIGFNMLKFNFYAGLWYKSTLTGTINTSMAVAAGYRFTMSEDMSLRFMYSYDLQISGNLQGTGGAHEITVVLELYKVQIFGDRGAGETAEYPTFY